MTQIRHDVATVTGAARRSALLLATGLGAATLMMPLLDGLQLIAPASAAQAGAADVVRIGAKDAVTVPMAEWDGGEASGKGVAKAPSGASHYESKAYQYPSGLLRTLSFKKGKPIFHKVTSETSIYVLAGSITLYPLSGDPVTLNAGDVAAMPTGTLKNDKPEDQTVLLLADVRSTVESPKSSIVLGSTVKGNPNLQWQEGGKDMSASKPEDIAKAPPGALNSVIKRYGFEGNSIRVASFKAGGKGNTFTISRTDVLIYIPQGRFRRHEGDQTFELKAGDTTREKIGNPGYWEPLENDSVFISTDAPATDPVKK